MLSEECTLALWARLRLAAFGADMPADVIRRNGDTALWTSAIILPSLAMVAIKMRSEECTLALWARLLLLAFGADMLADVIRRYGDIAFWTSAIIFGVTRRNVERLELFNLLARRLLLVAR